MPTYDGLIRHEPSSVERMYCWICSLVVPMSLRPVPSVTISVEIPSPLRAVASVCAAGRSSCVVTIRYSAPQKCRLGFTPTLWMTASQLSRADR